MAEQKQKAEGQSAADITKKLSEMQAQQRQLQVTSMQRQQSEYEFVQTESAIAALETSTGTAYKAIGSIIVEGKPEDIKQELWNRKETVQVRIESFKKQEERLKKSIDEQQAELQKFLERSK
ncbi:MAG: prefoldin subunit [DPANN group archaeon]|nr:prefoldin subunit [DPANN group archaeon]